MQRTKVIFVGNAKSNKSTIAKQLGGEVPPSSYLATLGVEIYFYDAPSGGKYAIWDCSGSFPGLGSGYWVGAQRAIIFSSSYEIHSTTSKSHGEWVSELSNHLHPSKIHTLHNATLESVKALLN